MWFTEMLTAIKSWLIWDPLDSIISLTAVILG